MVKGKCPTCCAELNDAVVTEESKIFKGHNVYVMCKHCGLVMVYNKTRELLYDLDKFKEDEDVLLEIKNLLEKECAITEMTCTGDCASCTRSCENKTVEEYYEVDEEQEEKEPVDLNNVLYMVHKRTDERRFIDSRDLGLIKNIDEWLFFEFQEVIIEPVVSYKIHRV